MKVLICTSPSSGLFRMKSFSEVALGPSWVAGGLEHYGFDVDYYDFDAALNKLEGKLSETDKKILSDFDYLREFINFPYEVSIIHKWVTSLCSLVEGDEYDYIGLSVPRMRPAKDVMLATLHFGIILSEFLIKKYNVPLYIGGNHILTVFKDVKEKTEWWMTKNEFRHFFIDDNSVSEFPLHLLEPTELKPVTNLLVAPKYDIVNKEDVQISHEDIFSDNILDQYPELHEVKEFTLLPLSFITNCIYNCAFCPMVKELYSTIPVVDIVDIIETCIEKSNSPYFRFYNSTINAYKKFVFDLTNEIVKRNLKIKFSDSADFRNTSPDIFNALKEAGCIKLWFGAETLSPRMLKIINKKLTPDETYNGLVNADRAGIWTALNFIVNFPGETEEDYQHTYNFIKDNIDLIDCYQVNKFLLLSGSRMGKHPEEYGAILTEDETIFNNSLAYNEVDGTPWSEVQTRGEKRAEVAVDIYRDKTNIWNNDYILFSASQVMDDKNRIRKLFKSIETELIEIKKEGEKQGNQYFQQDILSVHR